MILDFSKILFIVFSVFIFIFLGTSYTKAADQYCCYCATGVSLDKTKDKKGSCASYSTKAEAKLNCKASNCVEVQVCSKGCDTTKWESDNKQNKANESLSTSESLKKAQYGAKNNLNPATLSSPQDVIARGIKFILSFIGVITLALYLYAGFLWATSQGNAEKTGKATQILLWTTLGIVVMLSGYLLVNYIFTAVIG